MRECVCSPSNPFTSDSPLTHGVPSLVCPKTPCICCKTPCVCLFAVKLLAFPILQYSFGLRIHIFALNTFSFTRAQNLLTHSMGFRVRDEGTYSLARQIPLHPILLKPTAFPQSFALKLFVFVVKLPAFLLLEIPCLFPLKAFFTRPQNSPRSLKQWALG